MDFCITKYQGKPMESLTPLFKSMTEGIHRLERQEALEKAEAEAAREAAADPVAGGPSARSQRTQEDIARKPRQVTCRLAAMGNRCFWLSAAELTVHMLMGGDCIQTHNNMTIFTRTLQWAMQQCKKGLNGEVPDRPTESSHLAVQPVAMLVQPQKAEDDDPEHKDPVHALEVCTTSTNATDDYADQG